MGIETAMNQQTVMTRVSRRYWKQTDKPVAWWPWGLLWLIGLVALFLIGALLTAPDIESKTQNSVQKALGGFDITSVVADGQHVSVEAREPESARANILARAKAAACNSWAGELTCPVDVSLKLHAPAEPAPVVPAISDEPRLHDFNVTKTASSIALDGEYSTKTLQDNALALASDENRELVDNTRVSGDAGHAENSEAVARTGRILPLLERGRLSWIEGKFSVRGVATAENAAAIRRYYAAATPALGLGDITLQVTEDTARCNESFAKLLSTARIQFQTGSAVVDHRSQALLISLSDIAKDCDGDLLVEGHTDNVGTEENNKKLSQRRADAVAAALRELGISSKRLRATGYGESTPIGDNATAAGRASNRRIVIRIAELN